jgi:hypothetical protein
MPREPRVAAADNCRVEGIEEAGLPGVWKVRVTARPGPCGLTLGR